MSNARLSIVTYAIGLGAFGLIMALFPNLMLSVLHVPATTEIWIRLFGVVVFIVALKAFRFSHLENRAMFQFDIYTRSLFATFLLVLVLLHYAQPILLLLCAGDYGSSLWTAIALRADRRRVNQAPAV
jgi:hypothetical protein